MGHQSTLLIDGYVAPKMQDECSAWDFADLDRAVKPLGLEYRPIWHMGFAKSNSRNAWAGDNNIKGGYGIC